jgi:hypothetical protein
VAKLKVCALYSRSEGNEQLEREVDTTALGRRSPGTLDEERTINKACFQQHMLEETRDCAKTIFQGTSGNASKDVP